MSVHTRKILNKKNKKIIEIKLEDSLLNTTILIKNL